MVPQSWDGYIHFQTVRRDDYPCRGDGDETRMDTARRKVDECAMRAKEMIVTRSGQKTKKKRFGLYLSNRRQGVVFLETVPKW